MALAGAGARSSELLDAVWPEVPEQLRPARRRHARRAPGQARGRGAPARRRRAPDVRADRVVSAPRARRSRRRPMSGAAATARSARSADPAGLAVPADRRLRLPVGLPHRRAGRLRRLDRVDVPAALRLAVGVRRDARPRRGQLAGRALRRLRAGRPALHPGHEHDRDDLDDAAGLAARGRRADDRRRGTTTSTAPATRARRPTTTPTICWCGWSSASRGRCRSRSCASRCSTTAPRRPAGAWCRPARRACCAMDADRRRDTRFRLFSDIRMGIEGNRAHGRHTMIEGEKRFCALSWTEGCGGPHTVEQAEEHMRAHEPLLAHVAGRRHLPRPPVALSPAALGAGAEGADVHAHRRARGRAHDLAAGDARAANATGTTATAGCATPPSRCGRCTRSA